MRFFGREQEIRDMLALWGKRTGSLVTCRGRRRIGKSTLIEKFAEKSDAFFIKIEGLRPKAGYSRETELAAFAEQLSVLTGADDDPPTSWLKAFIRLDREIRDDRRTVVLLDEVSWLAYDDDTFSDMLKIAWDNHWSKHDRLIVVVCGSVSGWIKEHFIDNGAFFGRRSLDLVVKELPLDQCSRFWGDRAARVNMREIIDVLAVTGGVPRYLNEINPGMSAADNIRNIAFRPKSVLREDFDEMFSDVITRLPTLAGKVIRSLVGPSLSVTEIAAGLNMDKGGRLSEALGQLEEAGLVASDIGRNPQTGVDVRERRYRLKDNYARFYLKYIEPMKSVIDAGSYSFVSVDGLPGWDSIIGLQFENMVVNNCAEIIARLHLGNTLVESAAPFRRVGGSRGGVQIDMLIQTHHCNYVVEIKRQREIGREVAEEVAEKMRRLGTPRGKSVRPVLVYDGCIAPIVETEGFFDALIPFRSLLGL